MRERKYYLDVLRIIACFCVLVNHTNNLVFRWQVPAFSETWYVSILYFFAVKIAVPIYLMISGALLLSREESYRDVFLKRFLPPAIAVFFWSMFIYWQNPDYYGPFTFWGFIKEIYNRRISNAIWYMYMYLALMLLLPILRKAVRSLKEQDFLYLTALHTIVLGVLPILEQYAGWPALSQHFRLPFFSVYIIYFVMGYYMEHIMPKHRYCAKGAVLAVVVCIVATVIPAWVTIQEYATAQTYSFFMDDVSRITIVLQSYAFFYLIKYIFSAEKRIPGEKTKQMLIWISNCTFGIYLMSDWMLGKLEPFYELCVRYMNRIPAVVLWEIAIFCCGLLITSILKQVPGVKKIL